MDKDNRRIIRVKEVILNIFIAVILASFGIWLIGGITYNVFQKEQIHQRILALEMLRNGQTQKKVATELNVSERTIRNWIKNEI